MAEQQIANLATRAAPLTRTTKDSEEFELLAVNANFDGTSAASAFLPCVEVVSDAGIVVARSVATETVAAGDSAEVTFAPFLGRSGSSTSAGFIKFVFDNVGQYLKIHTTGRVHPAIADGIEISATEAVVISSDTDVDLFAAGQIDVECDGDLDLKSDAGTVTVQGDVDVRINAQADCKIDSDGLSFFQVAAVPQQATPVTLGDVIALLRAYGLAA